MKELYITIERGGWYHAYSSKWSWFFGKEPILRSKTWTGLQTAIEAMKEAEGKRLVTVS